MATTLTVRRIIFIDSTVPDLQTLLDGIGADAVAVVLDPGRDGVLQIVNFLVANELSDLSTIQIVSHGSEGSITLGSTVLDNGNIESYADALAQIGAALAADGDIMLYGCDVAADATGQQFISALARLTDADVAASTDPTGAAALGGDWVLEASTGPIETAPAFSAETEANFNGLLGVFVTNEIISVSSAGVQGNAVSSTGSGGNPTAATNNIATDTNQLISSLSADGRYVAFVSDANTLASDSNSFRDVFLRDRVAGTTTLVSGGLGGAAADGPSFTASVSDDGNLVVFTSNATNLVAGDIVNTRPDIYVRNVGSTTINGIAPGSTEKISVGVASGDSTNGSGHGVISGNGQFVVFDSSDVLLTGDANQQSDVFIRDLATDTTTRISGGTTLDGTGGGGSAPDISTDGRWVVFESGANDLVAGDTNSALEIFRYDRQTGTIIRVSLTDTEGQANGASTVASVSDDGNIIAFVSTASNLVANDPNGAIQDVFVRNVSAGTTVRLPSLSSAPISQYPSVSADGRYVAFLQNNQILIYDLQTGQLQFEPFTTSGTVATVVNGRPLISADGTTVVFQSTATNLVASDTNGAVQDVFVTPAFWPPLPGRPIFGNEFGGTHPDADLFDFRGPISNDANIDLLTLTVTNVLDGTAERLLIDGQTVELTNANNETTPGLGLQVSVAVSGSTATVTITTAPAGITAAQLQALVDGLIYQNTSTTPGPLSRIVTLTGISEVGDAATQALSVAATVSPPNVTELVSISTDGVQGNNGAGPLVHSGANAFGITTGNETARAISDDGRYIVFQSTAITLVAGDTNNSFNGLGQDIFRHDMLTGETIRVSVANDGSEANALSANASISADGNRVLFVSDATNLLPTADPAGRDLFIRDINAGTTTKVNLTDAGAEIVIGGTIEFSEISGDGTAAAFATLTQGYVAADTDSVADIYVRLLAGNTLLGTGGLPAGPTTVRVSVADNEAAPNGNSNSPSISSTGRFVAFASLATNLVSTAFGSEGGDDTNGLQDIFVRDLVAGTTKRVNLVEAGATDTQATTGLSFAPALSADGSLIVFASTSQLTASDTDSGIDIYLRNIGTTTVNGIAPGTTILVSGSPLVTLGVNTTPTISPDGEHIAFLNTNATSLWVYDVLTGLTGRAVSTTTGALGGNAAVASLSNDSLAFQSGSQQLVPNDTVAGQDVFWAPVETLQLGGTIWNDNGAGGGGIASNGIKDGTEPGIANVTLALFSDANNDNVPDNEAQPLQTATTSATGDYLFTGLAPGNYIVRVNQTNFNAGGALVATPLSPVTSPEPPDPDNDVDNDDNGSRVIGQAAFSNAITLAYGTEPTNDGDTIADTNFTLDFGFLGNPPPQILNLGGDTSTFTEGGPAVLLDDFSAPEVLATVTDDQASLNNGSLTVSITGNKVAAEDVLGFSVSPATTVTLSSGTSVGSTVSVGGTAIGTIAAGGTGTGTDNLIITFNSNATPALVSTLIQALTYADTNALDPSILPRTIAVSVNDGLGGTDSENVTVTVVGVNDEPTLIATAVSPTFTEGDALPADIFTAPIVAATIEAGQTFASLTLTVTNVTDGSNEVLVINGVVVALTNGNNVATGVGTAAVSLSTTTATVVLTGLTLNAADLQTLVDGIGYRNLSESPTDANRVVTITELVDSGSNTPPNDSTATLNIVSTVNVDAVNDQPVFADLNATPSFTENGPAVVLDNNATVSDAELDNANNYNGATLTLVRSTGTNPDDVFNDGSGTLTFGATAVSLTGTGQVGTYTQVNGTLVITFDSNATSAAVDSVLQQLTYRNTSDNPTTPSVTINYTFSDSNTGSQGTGATPGIATGSVVVTITAVNDAPVLDLDSSAAGSGFQVQFIPGVAAVPVPVADVDSSIGDVDDTNIEQATITVTNPQAGDVLSVLGALPPGISIDGASTPTNLILTGSATKADYETALEQVRYNNTNPTPDQTTRLINITVSDGTDSSNTAIASIVLNQPPTTPVDTDTASDAVAEGAAEGTLVGIDADSTDPDLNPTPIVYSLSANPSGFFSIDPNTGVVSVNAAGATGVDFETSGGSYNITVQATDGDGASSTQSFTINVTNVPPTQPVDTNLAPNTISEGAVDGATVAGFAPSSSDPNGPAVTFSLTDSAGGRFAIDASGILTVANAALLNFEADASHLITVQASDGQGGTSTADFTIIVTNVAPVSTADAYPIDEDNTLTVNAAAGVLANDSDVHGGAITAVLDSGPAHAASFALQSDGSFSYTPSTNFNGADSFTYHANDGTAAGNTVTVNLNVASINDAPVLGGAPASRVLPANGTALNIAPAATVSDVDNTTLVSATVRVSAGSFAGANDVLAANTTGTAITANYNPATETLTLSGSDTLANYQQVLESVTFDTTDTNPGNSGLNPTRTIQWQLNDGSAANNLSTIATTTVNVRQQTPSDFNGDAVSDVLWRHNNGFVAEWLMSDGAIGQNLGVAMPDPAWHFQDTGDFNADGKSDVLWRHDDGHVSLWTMDGSQITNNQAVGTIGSDWHNEGAGDFDGDGRADVLWHNDNGQVALWTMDGAQITNNQSIASVGSNWHFQGLLDANGDGKSDVLLRENSGQVVLWTMNGAQITNNQSVGNLGLDWNIQGTGDFNGDGRHDVMLRNDSGQVVIWEMNGAQIVSNTSVATPGNDWHLEDIGDYNSDGKSDVLWRNDGGQVSIWEMDGAQITDNHAVGSLTPDWATLNHRYDVL